MAAAKRVKTSYKGVYYRTQKRLDNSGEERTYYIMYRRGGRGTKLIEEPVGRSSEGMTAAKANIIRSLRASGKEQSNTEARAHAEAAKLPENAPMTIGRLWSAYAEHQQGKAVFASEKMLSHFIQPFFERMPDTLTTAEIDEFKRKLQGTPTKRSQGNRKKAKEQGLPLPPLETLSAATVKHILSLLKRILHYGEKVGLCPFPSGVLFNMPRLDNEKTETMTQEQMRAYFEALDAEPDQNAAAFLRVALLSGMRKGAIIGLTWDDLDFEHNIITLRGENAKKGRTDRIPMSTALREVFRSIERTKSPYVFPGKEGGKRQDFREIARRVRDKAGLPKDFRPVHALRHVYASFLASSGVSLYVLQKLLTHESPLMTKRYAHLADEALQKAANVANNIVIQS